jgi:hypothetical protein
MDLPLAGSGADRALISVDRRSTPSLFLICRLSFFFFAAVLFSLRIRLLYVAGSRSDSLAFLFFSLFVCHTPLVLLVF